MRSPPAASKAESKVARNFLALASGDALARVIAFAASVYVARELGPAAFGAIAFALAVLLYFQNAAECGIDLLGVRHIAEDEQRIATIAPALIGARVLVSLGLCAIAVALGFGLVEIGALPALDGRVLAFYGLTLIALGPNTKWIHLGLQDARPIAVARTLGESTLLLLVLAFVREQPDVARVPLFQLCGDALATTILIVWLRAKGFRASIEFDWAKVKPIFARSWPLVANVLLGLLIYNSNLLLLRFLRGAETAGWYAAAYQLIGFLINVAAAYSLSFLSALARVHGERERRESLYHRSMATMFALALPIAIGGSMLAAPIVDAIWKHEFLAAAPVLAILVWTLPFTVSKEVDLIALVAGARERTVMGMTAATLAVSIALTVALTPAYGMLGAAWATLITEAVRAAIARRCALRLGYSMTGVQRYAKASIAGVAMAATLWLVEPSSIWIGVPLGAAVYGVAMIAVGGVDLRGGRLPALRV